MPLYLSKGNEMTSFSTLKINTTLHLKKVFVPQNKDINDASIASLVDDKDARIILPEQLLEQNLKRGRTQDFYLSTLAKQQTETHCCCSEKSCKVKVLELKYS